MFLVVLLLLLLFLLLLLLPPPPPSVWRSVAFHFAPPVTVSALLSSFLTPYAFFARMPTVRGRGSGAWLPDKQSHVMITFAFASVRVLSAIDLPRVRARHKSI